MIKFTHNIWTAGNTDCLITAAESKHMPTATRFVVSWNCKNFLIERYTFRPQTTDLTIDEKLSSSNTISEAFFATCVPVTPIASPISALIRAGASLEPSPVTPTTWPSLLIPSTSIYLCSGLLLASTTKLSIYLANIFFSSSLAKLTFFNLLKLYWITLFFMSFSFY